MGRRVPSRIPRRRGGGSWRSLIGRYVAGMFAVATAAVIGTVLLSAGLTQQESHSRAAALVARQSMLSHQLTTAVGQLATAPTDIELVSASSILGEIEVNQRRLELGEMAGGPDAGIVRDTGLMGRVASSYWTMVGTAHEAIRVAASSESVAPATIRELEREAAQFRNGLDAMVFTLQGQAEGRADWVRYMLYALLIGTLAMLALQALLLFRPALRRVQRRWEEWEAASAEQVAEQRQRLRESQQFDRATGLPNRSLLTDRMMRAMARTRRDGGLMALLLVDIDDFKSVNDRVGPVAADALLRKLAARVQDSVRDSDTLARLSGDEFAVMIEGARRAEDAGGVAQKILDSLTEPFETETGERIYLKVSIGIVVYPLDGDQVDHLLRDAGIALYSAKEAGGNRFHFFTEGLRSQTEERLAMIDGLRRALDIGDELQLVYQPKIDMTTGQVVGVEALLRWHHPDLGVVLPGRFIPLAEETDLIVPLGRWVLDRACTQAEHWRTLGRDHLRISVNVSSRQLRNGDLAESVAEALERTGLDPEWLEVELTEGSLIEDTEVARRTLERLKEMGVKVSIDDFGTGYSSLGYLKRFPIDTLKIDRSFIRDVTSDPDDAAISAAIVSLARSLRLNVVAEGVETPEQLQFVRDLGCDIVQGFLFSHPLYPEDVEAFSPSRRVAV